MVFVDLKIRIKETTEQRDNAKKKPDMQRSNKNYFKIYSLIKFFEQWSHNVLTLGRIKALVL